MIAMFELRWGCHVRRSQQKYGCYVLCVCHTIKFGYCVTADVFFLFVTDERNEQTKKFEGRNEMCDCKRFVCVAMSSIKWLCFEMHMHLRCIFNDTLSNGRLKKATMSMVTQPKKWQKGGNMKKTSMPEVKHILDIFVLMKMHESI